MTFLTKLRKKLNKLALIGLLLVLIVLFATYNLGRASAFREVKNNPQKTISQTPKSTSPLNKEFSFPIRTETGAEAGKFKLVVESSETRDDIILRGQKATAADGKTFLILNIKITNDTKQNLSLNTRNYFRIAINGNDKELLAPDIYNDPVEVQAISTKYTKVGTTINNSDKDIVLKVGEVDGPKTDIKIAFPKS